MESQSAGQKTLCAFAFKPATRNCVTVIRGGMSTPSGSNPSGCGCTAGSSAEGGPPRILARPNLRDDEPGQGRAPEC
jgi:hypothetical protein